MPEPIQEVLLDLDVTIQHILHEIRPNVPDLSDILPPTSNPAEESEYI